MFERYTERARRVIFFARYEASQFGSTTIETEHLLLGLLREKMDRFFPDGGQGLRGEIEKRLTRQEKVPTSIDLPLSVEGKRILTYAAEEAERLGSSQIGTEHLLLGMLREEKCLAAQILAEQGVKLNTVREDLARNPMPPELLAAGHGGHTGQPSLTFLRNPGLPPSGVVHDAETAMLIAKAIWAPVHGAETIKAQSPLQAELKFNVWIVTGSAAPETALFAFILQADGRILSVGKGTGNA